MKLKTLLIILSILVVLLVYSLVCYKVLNKRIEINTRAFITNYFNTYVKDVSSYEYIKAVGNGNDSFKVFVKTDSDYYTFYFNINNHVYQMNDVTTGVPSYVD